MSETSSSRTPINVVFIRDWFTRYWLPIWFGIISGIGLLISVQRGLIPFFDAQLYLDATRTWLEGGNPWAVERASVFFAAPPPTLLPLVPFALLPHEVGVLMLGAIVAAASVLTIRMLRLPWWWLLFPPVVHSVLAGNVQALLVPLLLTRWAWLAVLFKVYAVVPLVILGRWRQLVASAGLVVITALLLPWTSFLSDFSGITARLADQSDYGLDLTMAIVVAPIALAALVVVGRERAAWLAVPAMWPSAQVYYATLALPTRSKVACALIAVPVAASGLLGLLGLALVITWPPWKAGRRVVWMAARWSSRMSPRE